MIRENDRWNAPANILTVIGLIISLAGNIFLWQQNSTTQLQVQKETLRADILQKEKDSWLKQLKSDLESVRQNKILIQQRITLTRQSAPLSLSGSQHAQERIQNDVTLLQTLETEEQRLEDQITRLFD